MFLFRREKSITHKQSAMIGFVLAVMSLLATAIIAYVPPLVVQFLYTSGVAHLELFFFLMCIVVFLAVQGLILFGFPIYYAQDKKSHMTGFQILVYAIIWMMGIFFLVTVLSSALYDSNESVNLDDLNLVAPGTEITADDAELK
jgi:hypothetical protein